LRNAVMKAMMFLDDYEYECCAGGQGAPSSAADASNFGCGHVCPA
jgi:hypothetical protein